LLPCKKGGRIGQMSVDILWAESGPHCWCSNGGRRMGRFSSVSSGKKLENVAIAWHCNLRPSGLPPPSRRTLAENCYARKLHLVLSKCVFKFQPSSSNSFRDMMGSQIYTRGCCTPESPLAEIFSFPKSVLGSI